MSFVKMIEPSGRYDRKSILGNVQILACIASYFLDWPSAPEDWHPTLLGFLIEISQ